MAEAVATTCYVLNRVLIRPILNKTSYELFYNRISKVSYFKIIRCKCFILNTRYALDKFDAKSNEGIFVGYSTRSKAYRIFNKKIFTIEESLHVKFDESLTKSISNTSSHDDDNIIDTFIDNTVISSDDTNISNVDETPTELPKANFMDETNLI